MKRPDRNSKLQLACAFFARYCQTQATAFDSNQSTTVFFSAFQVPICKACADAQTHTKFNWKAAVLCWISMFIFSFHRLLIRFSRSVISRLAFFIFTRCSNTVVLPIHTKSTIESHVHTAQLRKRTISVVCKRFDTCAHFFRLILEQWMLCRFVCPSTYMIKYSVYIFGINTINVTNVWRIQLLNFNMDVLCFVTVRRFLHFDSEISNKQWISNHFFVVQFCSIGFQTLEFRPFHILCQSYCSFYTFYPTFFGWNNN